MTSLRSNNYVKVLDQVLSSAVADDATVAFSYPSGYTQADFTGGLNDDGHYLYLDKNDKWTNADPGFSVSFDASEVTVTNLSGYSWAAGTVVDLYLETRKGKKRIPITIPVTLANITGAGDVVTGIKPGIDGYIEYWEFVTGTPVTTAAKAATLNLEIGTTNLTGGTIALTSAAATPLGKVIAASAITGNNRITRDDTLSVEAASVTAFAEGTGFLLIYIRPDEEDQY